MPNFQQIKTGKYRTYFSGRLVVYLASCWNTFVFCFVWCSLYFRKRVRINLFYVSWWSGGRVQSSAFYMVQTPLSEKIKISKIEKFQKIKFSSYTCVCAWKLKNLVYFRMYDAIECRKMPFCNFCVCFLGRFMSFMYFCHTKQEN